MKIQIINESREGHFYSHWTNMNGLIGILKSNELYGSNDGTHHLNNLTNVSLSRLGNGSGIPDFVKKDGTVASVKIVLDIGKLEKKYRISPIEFFNDPKEKDFPTQRALGDSEYEEAVVVGNTQQSANIIDSSGKYLGKVIIDLRNGKISKVLDSEGNKVSSSKSGEYKLLDKLYSIEVKKTSSGKIYGLNISSSKSENIFIGEDEFEEHEKGSIKDIKNYIVRIELADILFKEDKRYLVKSKNGYLPKEEYISQLLKDGSTSGLNSGEFQHVVNHNYSTLDKFLKFIEKELGKSKIRTFESPKSFYSIEGDKSKGEYTVISDRESDDTLYLIQLKSKEKYKIDSYRYLLVPAISDRKAIQTVKDCFSFDDSVDTEDISILPFNRIRHIKNSRYKFIKLPIFVKLMDKKRNCKSYFDFIKIVVNLGVLDKMDIEVVYNYSSKILSKKVKVDKDRLEIKVK